MAYPCIRTVRSALIKLSLTHGIKYLENGDGNIRHKMANCEAQSAWERDIREQHQKLWPCQ